MRWVVFDYGEVISRPHGELAVLADLLGVAEADFARAYWAGRHDYDRGLSDPEYWRGVGAALGVEVGDALAARLTEVDHAAWLHPDPGTVELVEELAGADVPLALLSNAPASFARVAEREPWARHFRHLVFSADLGVAKPDPRIFAALTERLGAAPGDCVFFDDRQDNVDGANGAGLRGVLWRGSSHARAVL
ncbi:HAD family hydrolase [Saccharothrix syringae]|uniref:HAD family phosphatase n=1 Tax=Saccharothrix syringae TaxID=103733 RepID=A0A5Q0HCZ2_SACSY|nr:HAD family phosphatase [Saccharothrix syringae]QFZ23743.1 HAD family phosphatase [Saccharothrix syringae]